MEENCSIKLFESDLESMLSQVLAKACSRDEKLKAAKEKSAKLKHQNEKLNAVLDLEKPYPFKRVLGTEFHALAADNTLFSVDLRQRVNVLL